MGTDENINLARIKKAGEHFEIAVDPDKAMAYREGKQESVEEALVYAKIFSDVKKGLAAADANMQKAFGTTDPLEVASKIIKEGEVQLTPGYRAKIVEEKRKRIVYLIHANGVDPRTHAPHPITRVENALTEAKVKIDEYKSPEEQVKPILKQLLPILPIKFEIKEVEVKIPSEWTGKAYGAVKKFGTVKKEDWLNDGSYLAILEISGGLEGELRDAMAGLTKGSCVIEVLSSR